MDLMNDDFNFASLKQAKEDTKKSKATIDQNAKDYTEKYKERIEEGTRKKMKLLEQTGLDANSPQAEDYFKQNEQFFLTKDTPILNFLYLLNEEYDDINSNFDKLKDEYEHKYGNLVHKDIDTSALKNDKAKLLEEIAEGSDKLTDDWETGEHVPHMDKYIYQNMDAGTFGKLKKLKALSMSDNEQEAKAAWVKCMELCNRFNLKFQDIPSKYD